MSLYEYLDVLSHGYGRIDFLWNMFIAVHLAIVGGLVLINRRISFIERSIAIIGYLSFLFVNYSSVTDAYNFQIMLLDQIKKLGSTGAGGAEVVAYIRDFDLLARIEFLDYAFLAAAVLTTTAILSANALSRGRWAEDY